ncbi:MAG: KdsC family phosphatase [Desulfosudaceae bacterium]
MNDDTTRLRLRKIKLLLLDVDGVLTDGRIIYTGPAAESKYFNVKDGLGLKMLMQSGVMTGIVTARSSKALTRRCRELGIVHLYEDVRDKGALLPDIMVETSVSSAEEVAFVGDDLPDIPLLKKVGLPMTVADAHPEVRALAALVTGAKGGHGAVREICEAILRAQDNWEEALDRYR